jgi:membrane-associated phospholipid phosphatase
MGSFVFVSRLALRSISGSPGGYRLKAHDLACIVFSFLFAVFSLVWPNTGRESVFGFTLARGHLMAVVYAALAAIAFLAPLSETRCSANVVIFLRTYYPQAFLAIFFTDSILLSTQALGGLSHDALFAASDQAIFGCQPAREFSRVFGSHAWINEIMFGSYFSYFAFMIVTVWIPYIKDDRKEGERQIFAVFATSGVVCTWYVFFRVQGPKYWLPDLHAAWYNGIDGGLFVSIFQHSLANANLSGAAFPSTHVILTLATLGLAYRNDKRFFALYLPMGILIICSTVYIYAHYATDILGGALVAMVIPPFFYRCYGAVDDLAGQLSLPHSSSY